MASTKILVDYDFSQNEVQNFVIQNLASAPASPKAGRPYFDTSTHTLMVYDGTTWKNALSEGTTYTFSTGLTNTSGTITLNEATTNALGGVIVGSNISVSSGTISVADASTSGKGVIEIATDAEASTGTDTERAINAKQLATKVTANNAITAGTATKITYDAKGLVTAGTTLSASDIPDISGTYVLQTSVGANNGIATLGADGKVPSSQLPSYVDDVIELLTLSSTAPATCVTGDKYYNTTSKKIFTATGTNTWGTTGATPESSIIYVATDTNASYRWSGTDMINIGNPISAATESTAGIAALATQAECTTGTNDTKIVTPLKMATYTSGMVKTTATQTLTNKTIDADDNTIQDLTTSNFKSGTIVTSVGSTGADTSLPTEKAVRSAIDSAVTYMPIVRYFTNTALTASGGVCTWTISHSTQEGIVASIREANTQNEVLCDITYNDGSTVVKINSSSNISAGTYVAYMVLMPTAVM